MTFAWPCLMSKNCVDPTTKYHGHLLLSHIIAKFAIHKRIVLQVGGPGADTCGTGRLWGGHVCRVVQGRARVAQGGSGAVPHP